MLQFTVGELEHIEDMFHGAAEDIDKDIRQADISRHAIVGLTELYEILTDIACKAGAMVSEL